MCHECHECDLNIFTFGNKRLRCVIKKYLITVSLFRAQNVLNFRLTLCRTLFIFTAADISMNCVSVPSFTISKRTFLKVFKVVQSISLNLTD